MPAHKQSQAATRQGSADTAGPRYRYATDLSELNSHPAGPSDYIRFLRPMVHADNRVSCMLAVFSLKSAPHYAALSYSWGAGDQSGVELTITEQIDGEEVGQQIRGSIMITRDLENALRRLHRHNAALGWLWFDSVCVHQANMAEKNDQVSMMRSIYQEAERVYVWLSEEAACDDAAEDSAFINKIELLNLLLLKERAWWYRLWVMQEMALARDVVVCLGGRTRSWNEFRKFVEGLTRDVPYFLDIKSSSAVRRMNDRTMALDDTRRNIQNRGHTSLLALVYNGKSAYTTEPIDKINGLLGLTSQNTRAHIKPSYGTGPAAVFAAACLEMVDQSKNLNALVGCWHRSCSTPQENSFPSWVPDYASIEWRKPWDSGGLHGRLTTHASGSSVPRVSCIDWRVLHLEGVQEGDMAIVAFGASVAFLLREVKDDSRTEKRYILLDGGIIYGVMNGELMDPYYDGKLRSESFEIV
ncbi:hypothetical protein LTS10_010393 [Elasticomyces elasticus]|nr:hypothetical protein LTS10_010393 [Elasticomyces elasticus]